MPDHQHHGPIQGVSTGTAAFLGEAERGSLAPRVITSYADYQRWFGGVFAPKKFLPHTVNGFFVNGGQTAYVCRVAGNGATTDYETALVALEASALREVSLVYAPNASIDVAKAVVAHCEKVRYRFAVIDSDEGQISSGRAAFYYPWIFTAEPGSGARTLTPPGGHVLGIYARTDIERGVFKAPANEVVRGALDVEFEIQEADQDTLNPRGGNVIRSFPGRGIRVWGARTLASEDVWKYVNVRRLFIFLERSIHEGTQWVVFEPNDERLWGRVTTLITLFLREQWRAGALAGRTDREAYFVKCDRTTMTQGDIDTGRLICEVGVAPLKAAEFVIFRIFQRTAGSSPGLKTRPPKGADLL